MSVLIRKVMMALASLAFIAFSGASWAQAYPARPIRMIVPFPAGGNADIVARLIGERLGASLGQPVVVDNRTGGGGIIGTELAVRAAPDGYTILFVANTHAINPSVVKQLPYDSVKDLAPISLVGSSPLVLVVGAGVPANNIKELIAFAKSKPGLNYGTTGVGSPSHLAGASFNSMAGVKLADVPYQSSVFAMNDLLGGHVQLAFPALTAALQHVKSGKIKALGITSPQRSPLAPDLPTVSEAGLPGYDASIWTGILAPAGTPPAIITRLNSEIVRILKTPEMRDRFAASGSDVLTSTPEEFKAYIESEIKKWAQVVREAGIKAN